MATSDIRAGSAYVEAKVKDLTAAGMNQIEARIKVLGESISNLGKKMAIAGAAITASFTPAILAAGEFQDTMGKFDAVYKETAAANRAWAEDFRKEVGRSKQEIYGFMADAQGLLVGIDFDRNSAAELSKTITKLSLDLTAFAGGNDEDAFKALISGISGESEPLKKYGVLLNETAVAAELLKKGIKADEASNTEKVYARLAIIQRSTKDATGALARESQGFNQQLARLKSGLTDSAVAIGSALLPAIATLMGSVSGTVTSISEWAAANPTLITQVAALGGGLLAIGGSLVGIGKGIEIFFALRASILTATAAVTTFSKALALAAVTNPLVIGLAALVVVGAAVGYMAYKASVNMDELRKATEAAGEAKKKLQAGDEQRKGDQTAVERLKQLNALQSLDADQKKEAADLTRQLNKQYDGLGLSIDGTTGKVIGLTAAFETMFTKLLNANAINDVTKNINTMREQLQALRDSQGKVTGGRLTDNLGMDRQGDDIRAKEKQITELMGKLEAEKKRLAALNGGDKSAITGNPAGPASTAQKVEEGAKQAKARADAEADAAKKLAELRDSLIQDEYNREIANINRKYDEEAKRLKELGASTQSVDAARRIELDKAKFAAEERWKKERDEQKKTAQEAKEKRNQEAKDANDKIADRAEFERATRRQLLEEQAKSLDTKGDSAGAEAARKQARDLEKQQENADLESKLEGLGLSDADKLKYRQRQAEIQRLQDDSKASTTVFKSQGTFGGSDAAIQSLQGGLADKQKEIAKNTADTAKAVKKIAEREPTESTFG